MSENKNFNDDIVFQSFSKNYIFESNKEENKISQNEILEFSFKKNLFLPKSDEYNSHNYNSPMDEHGLNIYSQNDQNNEIIKNICKNKYK